MLMTRMKRLSFGRIQSLKFPCNECDIKIAIFDFDGVMAVKDLPKGSGSMAVALRTVLGRKDKIFKNWNFDFRSTNWIGELREYGIDVENRNLMKEVSRQIFRNARRKGLIKLYPWVEKEIPRIAEILPLYILSNNSRRSILSVLKGLGRHFHGVYGWEDVPVTKPHPSGILKICRQHEVYPHQALMVGDSKEDEMAAMGAGAIFHPVAVCGQCPIIFRKPQQRVTLFGSR